MKARIVIDAITAAAGAAAGAVVDKLTGRDPARRTHPTIAEPDRFADKLDEQRRRGERP